MSLNLFSAVAQSVSFLSGSNKAIGDLQLDVVLEEKHSDELVITEHPVEGGAVISDHAYVRPCEIVIHAGFGVSGSLSGIASAVTGLDGNARLKQVYEKLLKLQSSRELVTVATSKRVYENMLIRSLTVNTDKNSYNILDFTATCRQVAVAATGKSLIPADKQRFPEDTQDPAPVGTKQAMPL